jgi:hypothetical protein
LTATQPPGVGQPVLYPNPVYDSGPVQVVLALKEPSEVRVAVYTTAFRKVNQMEFSNIQPGENVFIPLEDQWGTPLANGLYYLVMDDGRERYVLKLIVLR